MKAELRDVQWAIIAPLLPPRKRRGRPRADDRQTLNGILWVLRSGARWRDLPREYGSDTRCHRRLQEWQAAGVWKRIWRTLLATLDAKGKVDWGQAFLDGSFVSAKKGEDPSGADGKARAAPST
ncbi:MAG: IS5 family transposase [Chloroflexota bacterium]